MIDDDNNNDRPPVYKGKGGSMNYKPYDGEGGSAMNHRAYEPVYPTESSDFTDPEAALLDWATELIQKPVLSPQEKTELEIIQKLRELLANQYRS